MEDIRIVAKRLRRMLKAGKQAVLRGVFWGDLQMLIDLILEEEKDEEQTNS